MQVFRRSFIARAVRLKTVLVGSLLAVTLPGTFVAAQQISTRMVPNPGNQCVATSDVNALIHNGLMQPGRSIGLSKLYTPKEAVARLDGCLRRKGLGNWWGVTVGTPDQRRIFCECNKEITDTQDIECDGAEYRYGDGLPGAGCEAMKRVLDSGGLVIMKACLKGALADFAHAVTVVDIDCNDSAGGQSIRFIDSNELARGIITSPLDGDGELAVPPFMWSDGVRYDFKWLCGFVTKAPISSPVADPVTSSE